MVSQQAFQKPVTSPSSHEDNPLLFFWKGVCNFFDGLFHRNKDVEGRKDAEMDNLRSELEAEKRRNEKLQVQLDDRNIELEQLKAFFHNEITQRSDAMKVFLQRYAEEGNQERMEERKAVGIIFERHETLVRQQNEVVQLYEKLRTRYVMLCEELDRCRQRNFDLMRGSIASNLSFDAEPREGTM